MSGWNYTEPLRMIHHKIMNKGLGQLEAYAGEKEGVAFRMDNGMFWNSIENHMFGIQAATRKSDSCRFFVTITEEGKVALSDCRGWFLAPLLMDEPSPCIPLQQLHRNWHATSEFTVFHKGNKVAFQTHNGSFLTKAFRGVYIVEASKTSVDSSCFFQPEIGTLLAPDFTIVGVIIDDSFKVRCTPRFRPCVLKKDTFVNRTEEPLSHTFALTWAEGAVQTTAWQRRWGLGMTAIAEFTVKGMEAVIKYNQDNDKVVFVPQHIFETLVEEVELPPRSKATAQLSVYKHTNAVVPFLTKIRKRKPNGIVENLYEPGIWKGLVYHSLKLEVTVEPLGTSCTVM